MKKTLTLFMIFPLLFLLFACSSTDTNTEPIKNSTSIEEITLTFIQHTYLRHSYDEETNECNGYYFVNDELARTVFKFEKGYYLTSEDIDNFGAFTLNYDVPNLVGDGYWSFTFFTTSFNEKTGFSYNYLRPCKLFSDLTVHFGIFG